MIGAVASGSVYTALSLTQQAAQTVGVAATTAVGGDSDNDGDVRSTGAVQGDQAQISGPGQLLGQLQQLQAQDPTKFTQLVNNIADQLTSAAQQSTGPQSQFLTDLASLLQSSASTGNLSALQAQNHTHHGHGIYNQQGQVTSASSLTTSGTTGDTTSGSSSLQQLFTNIATEITQAIGG